MQRRTSSRQSVNRRSCGSSRSTSRARISPAVVRQAIAEVVNRHESSWTRWARHRFGQTSGNRLFPAGAPGSQGDDARTVRSIPPEADRLLASAGDSPTRRLCARRQRRSARSLPPHPGGKRDHGHDRLDDPGRAPQRGHHRHDPDGAVRPADGIVFHLNSVAMSKAVFNRWNQIQVKICFSANLLSFSG